METKRKALGKGLEQLFSNERIDFNSFESEIVQKAKPNDIIEININEIRSNPYQPRKVFDESTLAELASSIKEHGVVQPIIVKESIKGYELIAGERRVKASKIAGFDKIPAIIRNFNDQEMMEIALVENIQRENLNPIEEANAFNAIINGTGITQEELAKKFGKSRSHITNLLGLLRLSEGTKKLIADNKISMGHARVLSKIANPDYADTLAQRIIAENLSVRDIEKIASAKEVTKTNKINRHNDKSIRYKIYENSMREKIGTKVNIGSHKIEIPFDSEKDLERILEILGINIED
ncbi:MAG TPA: ParB/RepB/Spo0J family partition protein [Bacilli bacterium]|nr:ParB/RepB/Spo0J family partition protein [Bacilli bacterium]